MTLIGLVGIEDMGSLYGLRLRLSPAINRWLVELTRRTTALDTYRSVGHRVVDVLAVRRVGGAR